MPVTICGGIAQKTPANDRKPICVSAKLARQQPEVVLDATARTRPVAAVIAQPATCSRRSPDVSE